MAPFTLSLSMRDVIRQNPSILPENPNDYQTPRHGFDKACGDYKVHVTPKASNSNPSIEIRYKKWFNYEESSIHKFLPWNSDEKPSVEEIKGLLKSANIDEIIQNACAIDLIERCMDDILIKCEEEEVKTGIRPPLSSVLVEIETAYTEKKLMLKMNTMMRIEMERDKKIATMLKLKNKL